MKTPILHSCGNVEEQTYMRSRGLPPLLKRLYFDNGLRMQIHRYVLSNQGSAADAEDVFQDAFLVLLEWARDNRLSDIRSPSKFLWATARNIWLSQLRKQKSASKYLSFQAENRGDAGSTSYAQQMDARYFISRLKSLVNARSRSLMHLWMNGYTMDEIAAELDLRDNRHAAKLKYRTLKRLRQTLCSDHPEYCR